MDGVTPRVINPMLGPEPPTLTASDRRQHCRTVSTVLENTPGTRQGSALALKHFSIDALSDGADGADHGARRLCARCPHPNDARARSSLTTKGNFDPNARSGVCARRRRPASARGDFGHPAPDPRCVVAWIEWQRRARGPKHLPLHIDSLGHDVSDASRYGSASTTSSMADRRFAL